MTERSELLAILDRLPPDEEVVLATVVKVEGSAYRRPGARMLIPRHGRSVGTLSGGCLESEVSKKAWWYTEQGQAVLRRYSTAIPANQSQTDEEWANEEAEWHFGLGCNGTVFILFQRLPVSAPLFELLRHVEHQGQPAAQAIVIGNHLEGPLSGQVQVGDCLSTRGNITAASLFNHPAFQAGVQAELAEVLHARQTRQLRLVGEQGELELLLEYLPANPELIIVGAGHDAEPLVSLAAMMGWQVTVIDGRRHFARPERFPRARRVLCLAPDDAEAQALPSRASVVIMTHSYAQDRDWLRHFLRRTPLYLGQLGPKSRTERLLGDLVQQADPALSKALAALHSPVGLDLGGSTPEAVALAILAEVEAVRNGRFGGKLTGRDQPIHQAEPERLLPLPSEELSH